MKDMDFDDLLSYPHYPQYGHLVYHITAGSMYVLLPIYDYCLIKVELVDLTTCLISDKVLKTLNMSQNIVIQELTIKSYLRFNKNLCI